MFTYLLTYVNRLQLLIALGKSLLAMADGYIVQGSTVSQSQENFNLMNQSVTFMGVVGNYTNEPLIAHEVKITSGYFQNPIKDILPGTEEAFASHKKVYSTFGCCETLS